MSNEPKVGKITTDSIDNLEKCGTLTEIKTPNRIDVICGYPLEGQFITLLKSGDEPTILTLNEVQPILLGKKQRF